MTPEQREYTLLALGRYWPKQHLLINQLPLKSHGLPAEKIAAATCTMLPMPEWCDEVTIDSGLLVPGWAAEQANNEWINVDWIAVCFWYLNNLAERAYEESQGPVHSYSYRLKGWDSRIWEYAWVNRIALFLRKWLARQREADELELLGELPSAEIVLTHDVDAVTKTIAIRVKQSVFNAVNAMRALLFGKFSVSIEYAIKTLKFMLSQDDYWCFDKIIALEKQYGVRSTFNFYAGNPSGHRGLKLWLLDPAYDVNDQKLKQQLHLMYEQGWSIGLHQSFSAWRSANHMQEEKARLEQAMGCEVNSCRQHWLRFSFVDTWHAQQDAGFTHDTTLGFNDRPAFRNAAALSFHPWSQHDSRAMKIQSLPLVLMDSHFFDYQQYSELERLEKIGKWIAEVKKVGGQASIVWHQRVMSEDYGWGDSYAQLLKENYACTDT